MAKDEREHLVYSPEEARKLLKISRGLIYEAINTGRIPSIRIGRRILIPRSRLERLLNEGADAEWRRDVLAATVDWSIRFQEIANKSGLPRSAAGLAQDMLDLPAAPDGLNPEALAEPGDEADEDLAKLGETHMQDRDYLRTSRGDLTMLSERLDQGIADRRLIVKRHPLSPRAHFELGSFLGMAGKWLLNRELIDEGITECWIAAGLRDDWDAPAVEPGIILANAGYPEEALVELDRAAARLPTVTPHLSFSLGYVRMMVGNYGEALEAFENVISANPEYALALTHAAHCSFLVSDKARGIRYAKAARKLGEAGTYRAWRKGAYGKRKQGRR